MCKVSFYIKHPELERDEVFLRNIFPVSILPERLRAVDIASALSKIPFEGIRLGAVAYDAQGGVISDALPVFAKRDALLKSGKVTSISHEGEVLYVSDLRDRLLKNIEASRKVRMARLAHRAVNRTTPRAHCG